MGMEPLQFQGMLLLLGRPYCVSVLKAADHTVVFLGSTVVEAALSPTMAGGGQPSMMKRTRKWWSWKEEAPQMYVEKCCDAAGSGYNPEKT